MKKKTILSLNDCVLDKTIKIQGTKFDRKRRLSDQSIKKMKKLYKKGKSITALSNIFDCDPKTVKYNVDPMWKIKYNAFRSGAHTGQDKISFKDRVDYKRALVKSGKIKV